MFPSLETIDILQGISSRKLLCGKEQCASVDVTMDQLSFTILTPMRKYTCIGELKSDVWKLKTCAG